MTCGARRIRISDRREPTTGWEARRKAAVGLVFVTFSLVWIAMSLDSTEGVGALLGGVLGLVIVSTGLGCLVGAVQGLKATAILRKASTPSRAVVLHRYSEEHQNEDGKYCTYHLVLQFQACARPVTVRATVPQHVYNAAQEGQSVNVRYANADPRIALIEEEGDF